MANAGRKGTVSDGFSLNYLLLIAYFSPRRAGLNAENALNTFHSVFNGSPVKKITNRERDPCGPQSLSLFAMWIPYKGPDFPTLRNYPELPPRVEYQLTDRGHSMLKPLAGFTAWIRDTWQDIEASRKAFDEAAEKKTTSSR
ncbi:hypothetical protein TUM17576_20300 [Enterobacter hormaechei]|nr:hypothetical protein TUM17576_20300 [Enterobacter hormaechei]